MAPEAAEEVAGGTGSGPMYRLWDYFEIVRNKLRKLLEV
jgi:hypothetical protein